MRRDSLEELTGRSVRIYPSEENRNPVGSKSPAWCYENIYICGFGETQFSREKEKYIPIRSAGTRFGVLAIDCAGKDLNSEELSV
jgi:hypothetical protein